MSKEELSGSLVVLPLLVVEWWSCLEDGGGQGKTLDLDYVCFNTASRAEYPFHVPFKALGHVYFAVADRVRATNFHCQYSSFPCGIL